MIAECLYDQILMLSGFEEFGGGNYRPLFEDAEFLADFDKGSDCAVKLLAVVTG